MSTLPLLARSTCAAAALAAGLQASAAELRLVGAETSFYCQPSAAGSSAPPTGLACEIMAEMARRVGHSGKIQLYPLARALMVTSTSPDVLVAPVARIAVREKQYQWQVPLLEEEFVVVARKDSAVDISSAEAVRQLALGVVRDGAGERLARERGFGRVSLVAHDDLNARKLQAGRVDAWLSSWNGILSAQRNVGLGAAQLRRGVVLSRTQIYMASAPGLDPALLAGWRAALEAMKRDGSYDQLLRKYQYELPK
jgi:polar amino acid transport system substrate-binding protein